ncbi:hypothetical protein LRP52_30215 [Photobacterium sp. ZSDE20]|uniref:YtkA-like domain-containing protein n=1 Tax=Photobacterium pectinilyticum TaxID=2906793 RepID=A0ABT1N573_9GAMM|nr:hypothetical protein [Photobacterium sp. ZSDE20]MCQ1059866.1 hypothetical protein [Photobacterium sp. ZSDE20]MDD1826457.1 hypothetical protein [Photobacterium sp. ZSDE20]
MKTLTSVTWEARKIMAAEKLTKGRFIQIIFLMTVLVTAFVWRTVTYDESEGGSINAETCELTAEKCINTQSNKSLKLSLSPYPAVANQIIEIQIHNIDVKPEATVEGVNMYMGIIPVTFEKKPEGWVGRFSVPECMHDEMQWAININQGKKKIIAVFTTKK